MQQQQLTAWQKLYRLLELERKEILQVLYYAIFAGIISLVIPLGIQAIINYLQGAQVTVSWIMLTVIVTLGVGFVGVLRILQLKVIEDIQLKIFTRTSFEFTYRFPNMRVNELSNFHPPELANRFFDVPMLQKGVQKLLLDLPTAFLQIVLGIILISFYHSFFIMFGLIILLFFFFLFKFTNTKATQTSITESGWKYKTAFWIQQVASQFKTLKMNKDEYEFKKLNNLVGSFIGTRQKHFKIVIKQYQFMVFFQVIITFAFLLVGGFLVLNQEMNIGQFIAAEIIIVGIVSSIEKLGTILESIYDLVASVDKISQVTDEKLDEPLVEKTNTPTIFPIRIREVKIQNLNSQSFDIKEYEHINLVGHQLQISVLYLFLAGMKNSYTGKILLNNEEIQSVDLKKYQYEVAMALNADELFEGTIWENISFNAEVNKTKVLELLKKFNVLEEIQNLPLSFETKVFPRTELLSKRCTQFICLMRALIKNPRLLMLEDGFVFSEMEQKILKDYANENSITLLLASSGPLATDFKKIHLKTD